MQAPLSGPGCSGLGSHGFETPHSSGSTFAAKLFLQLLNHCTWGRSQPSLHLCPTYHAPCGFCKSLVRILLYSCCSVGYSVWLLYNLAKNMVGTERRSVMLPSTLQPSQNLSLSLSLKTFVRFHAVKMSLCSST